MQGRPRLKRLSGVPARTTGRSSVSAVISPWWESVMAELLSRPGMVGRELSIEELTALVPDYPDGGRPRPRAVARRLRPIIELLDRGPNGSRGRGATYRIVANVRALPVGSPDVEEDAVRPDLDWLLGAVDRMTEGDDE